MITPQGQSRQRKAVPLAVQGGFTLIELMIVVVIAGILMAVAVPMFEDSMTRNRRLSALESITGVIASARSEAVARSTTVSMCPSEDSASCTGLAWETGVLVFEDDDRDRDYDSGEELIRVLGAAGSGVTIRSMGGFDGEYNDGVMFNQFGAVDVAGTLVICDADKDVTTASGVVLNPSGQARLAVKDGDSGVLVLDDETNLGACP